MGTSQSNNKKEKKRVSVKAMKLCSDRRILGKHPLPRGGGGGGGNSGLNMNLKQNMAQSACAETTQKGVN